MRDEIVYNKLFSSWYNLLKPIVYTERFDKLLSDLNVLYKKEKVFPQKGDIFNAFRICPYNKLKVVILAQDPYFTEGQATGLAFANPDNALPISPSLQKIFNSIERDYYDGLLLNPDITLESWAKQGVLLLNSYLTVRKNAPGSHSKIWGGFCRVVLKRIADNNKGVVFCLWGNDAKQYKKYIEDTGNYIVEAEHPAHASRQQREWLFSFKEIDRYLINKIKW